jgi:hypothetical protein
MHFIQPEMPTQNCFVESFNGTFRDGCLNASWFVSLADACRAISSWRRDYKRVRPHSRSAISPGRVRLHRHAVPKGTRRRSSSTQLAAPASEAASDRGL